MQLSVPVDQSLSLRLSVGTSTEPSDRGPRLGGRPPAGLDFSALSPVAVYVLTVPLSEAPALELSVFVNCGFDTLVQAQNDGAMDDDRVVLLAHPSSFRGTEQRFASLSEHPIFIGPPEADQIAGSEDGCPVFAGDKVGGRPYCIQEEEFPDLAELDRLGFRHLLQLDVPFGVDLRGQWPLGGCLFNVFARPPFSRGDFRWAIQD